MYIFSAPPVVASACVNRVSRMLHCASAAGFSLSAPRGNAPMGYYSWKPMLVAATIGAVGAIPISWLVARRIQATDPQDSLD